MSRPQVDVEVSSPGCLQWEEDITRDTMTISEAFLRFVVWRWSSLRVAPRSRTNTSLCLRVVSPSFPVGPLVTGGARAGFPLADALVFTERRSVSIMVRDRWVFCWDPSDTSHRPLQRRHLLFFTVFGYEVYDEISGLLPTSPGQLTRGSTSQRLCLSMPDPTWTHTGTDGLPVHVGSCRGTTWEWWVFSRVDSHQSRVITPFGSTYLFDVSGSWCYGGRISWR